MILQSVCVLCTTEDRPYLAGDDVVRGLACTSESQLRPEITRADFTLAARLILYSRAVSVLLTSLPGCRAVMAVSALSVPQQKETRTPFQHPQVQYFSFFVAILGCSEQGDLDPLNRSALAVAKSMSFIARTMRQCKAIEGEKMIECGSARVSLRPLEAELCVAAVGPGRGGGGGGTGGPAQQDAARHGGAGALEQGGLGEEVHHLLQLHLRPPRPAPPPSGRRPGIPSRDRARPQPQHAWCVPLSVRSLDALHSTNPNPAASSCAQPGRSAP